MANQASSRDKTLDILCLFAEHHFELSVQEIAELLRLPLSSTYKYLDALIKKELLIKDRDSKKYRLGLTAYKLGTRFTQGINVLDIAHIQMKALSHKCGEMVFLTVLYGWEGLILAKIEVSSAIKISAELGSKVPINAGAAQKVLLAFQKKSFLNALIEAKGLIRLTPNTVTDPEVLKEQLKLIRKRGYDLSHSEVQAWAMSSIAAPIFDINKQIVASLSIGLPSERLTPGNQAGLIQKVTQYAGKISQDLGFGAHQGDEFLPVHEFVS